MLISFLAKSKEGHQLEGEIDTVVLINQDFTEENLTKEDVNKAFNVYIKDVKDEDWTSFNYEVISYKIL